MATVMLMPSAAGAAVKAEAWQQQREEAEMMMVVVDSQSNPVVMLEWLKGEFAAANAIIDALCTHIAKLNQQEEKEMGAEDRGCSHSKDSSRDYEEAFAAIKKRRTSWFPILHMRKYFSISDISFKLQRVLDNCRDTKKHGDKKNDHQQQQQAPSLPTSCCCVCHRCSSCCNRKELEQTEESERTEVEGAAVVSPLFEPENSCGGDNDQDHHGQPHRSPRSDDSPIATAGHMCEADSTNGSSQEEDNSIVGNHILCDDHKECMTRRERINVLKGFVAKETIKGHTVNVAKGMKVYEGTITDIELLKLDDYIRKLRIAGQNGELPGGTYISFNKELKGNRREIIQLGVPLYQPPNDKAMSSAGQIPPILQDVINHLLQWRLIPQSKWPNSCIISFFDEGEHSQPYFKPPHLDNPISTLFLQDTELAFGRTIMSDNNGNYKGSLALTLKKGSLLVLRGNSADKARHVVCSSAKSRVSITFSRVRSSSTNQQLDSSTNATNLAMMPLCMPDYVGSRMCNGLVPTTSYVVTQATPLLMLVQPPMEHVLPMRLVDTCIPPTEDQTSCSIQDAIGGNGTGVFLPWTMGGSKKYLKQIPPRFQKRKPSMASPLPPTAVQAPDVKASSPVP